MKRLKVQIKEGGLPAKLGIYGGHARLLDADTGEELGCVRDFSVRFPVDDVVVVHAELLVSEVEVVPGVNLHGPPPEGLAAKKG